jgi:hypothetical protein
LRLFKINSVFPPINDIFGLIKFELHNDIKIIPFPATSSNLSPPTSRQSWPENHF